MRREGIKNGVRIFQILELQNQGKNQSQIARELGITRQAVSAHLKKRARISEKPEKRQKKAPKRKFPINWSTYNKALIKRGEFILPLELFSIEEEMLHEMNFGKRGRHFKYSDAIIELCFIIRTAMKLDYRTAQGMGKKIFELFNLQIPHYTTVCKRDEKLLEELTHFMKTEEIEIAVDGTCRSQSTRGNYRESQYETEPCKFVRLVVGVDTKTKEVTVAKVVDGDTSETRPGKECIQESITQDKGKVKKVFTDRLFDNNKLRAELIEAGISPVIPPKIKRAQAMDKVLEKIERIKNELKNYPRKDRYFYNKLAEFQRLLDILKITDNYEKWRDENSYGKRNAAENFFSRDTLFFGDKVASKKLSKAQKELLLRCNLLNIFIVIGKAKSKQELLSITAIMKQKLIEQRKAAISRRLNKMT